jgi:hypothetical protein
MRSRASLAALTVAAAVLASFAAIVLGQSTDDAATRVAALRTRLGAVTSRATRIDDINRIENLQGSYGYYVDKMLWDEVVDLFADDATIEIGPSGVYVGKNSIRRYLSSLSGGKEGPLPGVLNDHFELQPIVTVASDGLTAKGRWRLFLMTGVSGSGSGGNWGEGIYENEYVKQNGVWKIQAEHLYTTFTADYLKGWAEGALPIAGPSDELPPDRPPTEVYESFPAFYTLSFHYDNPVSGQPPVRK